MKQSCDTPTEKTVDDKTKSKNTSNLRTAGRRKSDFFLTDQVKRLNKLTQVGQTLTTILNMDELFEVIVSQTNQIVDSERCSVLLYDPENEELYSLASTDVKKDQIRFPSDKGIAGWVLHNKKPLIINDPYNDPRFNAAIDKKTGVTTHNILCIPLINRRNICIGTLQNMDKRNGDFDNEDLKLLQSASHYITIALENAKLYNDLKELDRAKEKIINHLSHELKTPLSIILGVFDRIRNVTAVTKDSPLHKTLNRGERNAQRLIDLQLKIDDILHEKAIEEKEGILNLIHSAVSLVDETYENNDRNNEFVAGLLDRLTSLFATAEPPAPEHIELEPFLTHLCDQARHNMGRRHIEFIRTFEGCGNVYMDRRVLEKVIEGLLKNAIENTPDEGRIVIRSYLKSRNCYIEIRDFGTGISPENQKMIFGGFFHTQDTMAYSSKRPYEFNAGGTGSDLLRIRALSERFNFAIDFSSKRCHNIPHETTPCPGIISRCSHVTDSADCRDADGSTFTIIIPLQKQEQ